MIQSQLAHLFPGFSSHRLKHGGADLFWLSAGRGPALMLLHGYPQTLAAWHAVAARLCDHFTLVLPDLRGYGRSLGPAADQTHEAYSKRQMADDALAIMQAMGFSRFALAGHDRGARVAYRLALDHPLSVSHLIVLDIVPTIEMWDRMSMAGALRSYHWLLLAQPAPLPERLIGADPIYYLHHLLDRWKGREASLDASAVADYEASYARPSVIEACCEDYRAGATIDRLHDAQDREANRMIDCEVLVIWAEQYLSSQSPLATWQRWAKQVRELRLDCGHFIAEEKPAETAQAIIQMFRASSSSGNESR
ncbi:MAG: alpha/beta hydrolase [Betaproteobacteria bacterium]|nr:alpha/beta hydrolase [Pseudomonadota bacterium]NBP11432.1 alpha/beta hydrolase [Betaproteobacteria bacterium]NBP62364.1 alpha/beta hydrolase [Betaproteobacteria bacterium]NBQ09993.1 alpha/beta hydrolase [Betaproteobacteria bacterium]NBQ82338.1 alpha/beta hydrolase [Betaproteobacteria bacterium]